MAISFFVGTPTDDGRIQEVRLIPPPPPPNTAGAVFALMWNPATLEPEWTDLSGVNIPIKQAVQYLPLTTDAGKFLTTDTGARLVAARIS